MRPVDGTSAQHNKAVKRKPRQDPGVPAGSDISDALQQGKLSNLVG